MLPHDDSVRYARQISLPQIGVEGQKKLSESSVLVVGAGGLGAPLALYLAGAGVGRIGLVDADRVALSNLPRQILYETADIGRFKVEAAADALRDRNPEVRLELYPFRLTASHPAGSEAPAQDPGSCALASGKPQDDEGGEACDLIRNYDIVADGSDNFATRLLVNAACHALKKNLVSAAVMGWRGQIATYKPMGPCYQCLIGNENPEDENCSAAGVLGPVAGMMACWQGTEVIKELLGVGESLAGKVLWYDALTHTFSQSALRKDPRCRVCSS